jgi:hypothetical protein
MWRSVHADRFILSQCLPTSNRMQIFTPEQAEAVREATNCPALDDDELGHLEEDIKELCMKLRNATTQVLFACI